MLGFSIWLRDAEPFIVINGLPGRNPGKPELKGESAELALRVYEFVSGRRRPRRPGWALRAEARVPGKAAQRLEEALRRFEADPTLESAEELLDAWFQASVNLYGKEATVAFYESHIKPQLTSFRETVPASAPDRVRRWRRAMRAWLRHARSLLREMTALDLARRLPHDAEEEVRVFGKPVPPPPVPAASSFEPASPESQPQRGRPRKDWRKVLEEKLLLQLEAERRRAERRKAKIERRKQRRAALVEEVQPVRPVQSEPVREPVQPVQEPVQEPVREPVQPVQEPAQAAQPVQQPVQPAQQPVVAAAPAVVVGGAKAVDDTQPVAVRRAAALFRPRR